MAEYQGLLSKSSLMRFLQCPKSLYLHKFQPDLRPVISEAQEAIFARGTAVGIMAQKPFEGGIDLYSDNHFDLEAKAEQTKEAINDGEETIYEAAFIFDGVYCAMDILRKEESGWHIYEVKSSTSVKDEHFLDTAIQYYILNGLGYDVSEVSLIHLNNQYVRYGELDYAELFEATPITGNVLNLQPQVPEWIKKAKAVLSGEEDSNIQIGEYCFSPYECDFKAHCWADIPEYSVFDIANLRMDKKFRLFYDGIVRLEDIPREMEFSANQWLQIDSELSQKTNIDEKQIRAFVESLNYPLYYLDFETFNPAVPQFDGSRPYQQIPCQYSLHVLQSPDSKREHFEFLGDGKTDPREALLKQLLADTEGSGNILAYNMGFEKSVMKELGNLFPEYEDELQDRIDRVVDLMIPFQQKWYYTPSMKGSYSIKYVLPALVPELSYKDLGIQNGSMAMDAYAALKDEEDEEKIAKIRRDLLSYCRLDTLAMVDILSVLEKV